MHEGSFDIILAAAVQTSGWTALSVLPKVARFSVCVCPFLSCLHLLVCLSSVVTIFSLFCMYVLSVYIKSVSTRQTQRFEAPSPVVVKHDLWSLLLASRVWMNNCGSWTFKMKQRCQTAYGGCMCVFASVSTSSDLSAASVPRYLQLRVIMVTI